MFVKTEKLVATIYFDKKTLEKDTCIGCFEKESAQIISVFCCFNFVKVETIHF